MAVTLTDVRANLPGPPPSAEPLPPRAITHIVLHHSQTARREGQPYGSAESIFQYQVGFFGWETGGYHYVIAPDGQVEFALAEERPGRCDLEAGGDGAAVAQANAHGLHLCLIGWFDEARTYRNAIGDRCLIPAIGTHPPPAQWAAVAALAQHLRAKHGLPVEAVVGHHELEGGGVSCPGANCDLARLRAELAARPLPPVTALPAPMPTPAAAPAGPLLAVSPGRYARLKRLIYTGQRGAVRLALLAALAAWWPAWQAHWLLGLALTAVNALTLLLAALRWVNPPVWAFALYIGGLLRQAGRPVAWQRQWVPLARMSPWLLRAAVATEDPHFFEHAGLAWGHVLFALRHNRTGRAFRGGSTITQQLVKNLFLWPTRSYARKAVEGGLAALVEAVWPKARILELYLNLVQLGVGVFGVEAASQAYLRQPAAALPLEGAALLVAVFSNPVLYRAGAPSRGVLGRRAIVQRNTLAYADPALNRLVDTLSDPRPWPARAAAAWEAGVLAYRVAALRLYLKRQGLNAGLNAHYRARALAHQWSTAHHLAAGQITLGALRQLPGGQDWDGTVWYEAAWDNGAPDATPAATLPGVRALAARWGAPNLNYAEEGYASADARRAPNGAAVPVSRHVAGQAIDVAVDWDTLGGAGSAAAHALVARFGLMRPVPAEPWHVEARPPLTLGVSPLRVLVWGLHHLARKARRRRA